jgi:hypothetical protein
MSNKADNLSQPLSVLMSMFKVELYSVMKLAPGSGFGIRIQRALKLKQSRLSAATWLANSTLRPINVVTAWS